VQLLQEAQHLNLHQILSHSSYAAKMTHLLDHAAHLHPGIAAVGLLSGAAVAMALTALAPRRS